MFFSCILGLLCLHFCSFDTVSVHAMQGLEEQRTVIKFLHKSGATPMECYRQMHAVYGGATVTPKTVRVWMNKFNSGETQVKDKARSGRPRSASTPGNI